MTMGASIECRVPFLDYRLVEGLAALPTSGFFAGRKGKKLLRQAIGDRLPESVLGHRKWGFGVPWGNYFRQLPDLHGMLDSLPDMEPFTQGAVNRESTKHLISDFLNGKNDHMMLVRQLLMIGIWHAGLSAVNQV